jgi:hypothetical protein
MRDIRELFPTNDPVKADLLIGHHGRGDWVIPEPLLRSYLAARL